MSAIKMLRNFRNDFVGRNRQAGGRPRWVSSRPLAVEPLEDRALLTTFVVDTPLDNPTAGDDLISLREAITAANTNLPFGNAPAGDGGDIVDQITFDESLIGQTIVLGGQQLTIRGHLSITGLGQDELTISGGNTSRVFEISNVGVPALTVDLSSFTISDGSAVGGGAAIRNAGATLHMTDMHLSENSTDHQGGGVFNFHGTVMINDSSLSGNFTGTHGSGGGIYSEGGTTTVTSSILSGNSAGIYGGGIFNEDGAMTVTNSTLSANSTRLVGAGVCNASGSVTIIGSMLSNNLAGDRGGGVFNDSAGTMIVNNSLLTNNQADADGNGYGAGGGISNFGTLTVASSTFAENSGASGGGVTNGGIATITTSAFLGNSASAGGGISHGGDSLTIDGSTFWGNSAQGYGGGIASGSEMLTISNTTISGNSAGIDGGGIYHAGRRYIGGTVYVTNCTLTDNRADFDGGTIGTGGGLSIDDRLASASLHNSLIAGNFTGVVGSDSPDDIFGNNTNVFGTHNLIGDAATSGELTDGMDGNIVGNGGSGTIDITTVLDTTLADNGGPTFTHALVLDSPAVNAGDDSKAVDAHGAPLAFDQRGSGFARIADGAVDIGAFEVQSESQLVQIDIKPGCDQNTINLGSNGTFAVAILSSATFDALTVDPLTVTLADAGVKLRGNGNPQTNQRDVNNDGLTDLVVHVLTDALELTEGDETATLTAQTTTGQAIEGTDFVRIVAALLGEAQGHGLAAGLENSQLDAVVPFALSSSLARQTHSSAISSIEVVIADLPEGMLGRTELLALALGETSPAGRITLDRDANGVGWYVDQTPFDHSEFGVLRNQSLLASPSSAASGRYDLFTVLTHEMSHLYGEGHHDDGLMAPTLAPGARHLTGGLFDDDHGLKFATPIDIGPALVGLLPDLDLTIRTSVLELSTAESPFDMPVDTDFDLMLAPLVADRMQKFSSIPDAAEVRMLDDVLDDETELVEEELLDLLLG